MVFLWLGEVKIRTRGELLGDLGWKKLILEMLVLLPHKKPILNMRLIVLMTKLLVL